MKTNDSGKNVRDEQTAKSNGTSDATLWRQKIRVQKADKNWTAWRTDARSAVAAYETGEIEGKKLDGANLLHSNVETIAPAIYNSTPIPDIRVRYDDDREEVKAACDMLERMVSYDLDNCRFDDVMVDLVRKASLVGEGVPRVRYEPHYEEEPVVDPMTGEAVVGEDGQPEINRVLVSDKVYPEVTPWDRIIFGPGRHFERLTWVAFEHDMTHEEVSVINKEQADLLSYGGKSRKDADNSAENPDEEDTGVFQTVKVFEVWDKRSKSVLWIPEDGEVDFIAADEDPFKLRDFFPFKNPLRPISKQDRMIPLVYYVQHKALFNEFEITSNRINALVKQLRVRGLYDVKQAPDFQKLKDALDGEYFPAESSEEFLQGGQKKDLSYAVMHWPLEHINAVISSLNAHREIIKGLIWEATGVADIMRGQSNASETLGAQQLKTEWGSMRVKKFQSEAARCARDIIRLMVEVRANMTPWAYMKEITAFDFKPTDEQRQQAQQAVLQRHQGEQAPNLALVKLEIDQMAQKIARQFEDSVRAIITNPHRILNIDIETDSTLRGDLTRDMDQFNQLIASTGAWAQGAMPVIQLLPETRIGWFKLLGSQLSKFRLGKRGEDALDELIEAAEQSPQQDNAPQQASAEEMQAQQGQREHEQQMVQQQAQDKQAERDTKIKLGEQKLQMGSQKIQHAEITASAGIAADNAKTKNEIVLENLRAALNPQFSTGKML